MEFFGGRLGQQTYTIMTSSYCISNQHSFIMIQRLTNTMSKIITFIAVMNQTIFLKSSKKSHTDNNLTLMDIKCGNLTVSKSQ